MEKIKLFSWLCYAFGGVLPSTILWLLDEFKIINIIPNDSINTYRFGIFCLFIVSIFIIASFTYEEKPVMARVCLWIGGIVALFSIHLFVKSTGGALQSYFSSYYLFIPVVTALVFPCSIYKGNFFRGWFSLAVVSVFSSVLFYLNLSCSYIGFSEWQSIALSDTYKGVFYGLFLIQVFIYLFIEGWVERDNVTYEKSISTNV